MMAIAAFILTLVATTLFYLSDREQRWLDAPLPGWFKAAGVLMLFATAMLWVLALGAGIGMMVWWWVSALSLLVMALVVGHQRDGFQKVRRGS